MKKRRYFRPRRPQVNKNDRRPDEAVFGAAREAVLAVFEDMGDRVADACTPGYPLVDNSARRCTFELSRDWVLTVRFLTDRPAPALGLSTLAGGAETAEQLVLLDGDLSSNLALTVSAFVQQYREAR